MDLLLIKNKENSLSAHENDKPTTNIFSMKNSMQIKLVEKKKRKKKQPKVLPGHETKPAAIILSLNPNLFFSIISQHKHRIITMEKGTRKLLESPLLLQRKAQLEWRGRMAVDCLGDDAQKSRRQCGAFKGFHCLARAKQSRQTLAVFDKDQTPSTPILPKIHNNSPA